MSSLLPPNATKLEKNAEKIGEKISSLAVPFIDLHRIDSCPAAHLPWLAWQHRVEYWQPEWSEPEKRNAIRESESFNAQRGTRSSITSLLSTVVSNFQLKAWHEFQPPQQPFTFVVMISTQHLLSIEQLLQVQTAIDATKSARDNYSISAKVKTDCDFNVTGSITTGTFVRLSSYIDQASYYWQLDTTVNINQDIATYTAMSSDGFDDYSSFANLDLTDAIVRSFHDSDMQQWQAVNDAAFAADPAVLNYSIDAEKSVFNIRRQATGVTTDDIINVIVSRYNASPLSFLGKFQALMVSNGWIIDNGIVKKRANEDEIDPSFEYLWFINTGITYFSPTAWGLCKKAIGSDTSSYSYSKVESINIDTADCFWIDIKGSLTGIAGKEFKNFRFNRIKNTKYDPTFKPTYIPVSDNEQAEKLRAAIENPQANADLINSAFEYDPIAGANNLYQKTVLTKSFADIAQQTISNTSSSNQAISLLAEAYLENVAKSIFAADESKQFVRMADLIEKFEQNKIIIN